MALMDAPVYDPTRDRITKIAVISAVVFVILAFITGVGGYAMGHGWWFSNLPAEHKVNNFFNALEAKDYDKAYAIWENDPDWKSHPSKYSEYPEQRFIEDWTAYSPIKAPILTHHVDISRTDGTGTFGSGIIVAVRVNGDRKLFMYVVRADGTLEYPAPHELGY